MDDTSMRFMNRKILELARKLYRQMDFNWDICNNCMEDCIEFDSDTTQPHHYPCVYIELAEKLFKDGVIVREGDNMKSSEEQLVELVKLYKRRAAALEKTLKFFVDRDEEYSLDDAMEIVQNNIVQMTNNEVNNEN